MKEFNYKITEAEFNDYSKDIGGRRRKFLDKYDNGSTWEYGYGCYGVVPVKIDGEYYAHVTIGSHCD